MTDPYAVTGWGKPQIETFDVVVPSGQRCQVRKLKMEDVLAHGILNDLDAFSTALLAEDGTEVKDDSPGAVMAQIQNPEKFSKLQSTVDKIIMITVQQPIIYTVPDQIVVDGKVADGPRVAGRVYIDQVGFLDKMEIFNQVFEGFRNLDQFREGQEAGLGTVEDVQGVQSTAELPAGDPS